MALKSRSEFVQLSLKAGDLPPLFLVRRPQLWNAKKETEGCDETTAQNQPTSERGGVGLWNVNKESK